MELAAPIPAGTAERAADALFRLAGASSGQLGRWTREPGDAVGLPEELRGR